MPIATVFLFCLVVLPFDVTGLFSLASNAKDDLLFLSTNPDMEIRKEIKSRFG